MKRQSSQRDNDHHIPYNQKIQTVKQLMKIIQFGKSIRIIDFLYGYTLSNAQIPLDQPICFDLKEKFNNLEELRLDRLVNGENIVFIILDAIYTKKSMMFNSSFKQQFTAFFNTLMYNIEESIINKNYILQKWRNQQALLQQNRKNELALKQFLQEEKTFLKNKAEEADSQGWECQICCCDIQKHDIGILQCGHIFHPSCVNGFLKAKIQSNETVLYCPMEECKKPIQISDIYRFIDGDLKQKFQKFTFNKFIQENNSSTSWCPTAGCQAAFEFDEQLDNYKCPACKKHYCLKCRCEYHHGMTCAEYRVNNRFDKNDEDFIKFVQGAKFKQCPKCKYWVERNDGCSTMSCKCGQQFCYDCGGTSCPHGSCSNSGRLAVPPVPARPGNFIANIFGGGRRKR